MYQNEVGVCGAGSTPFQRQMSKLLVQAAGKLTAGCCVPSL